MADITIDYRPWTMDFKLFLLRNHHLLHHIALTDSINHIQAFYHFSEYRMIPVKMLCVGTGVTNEELRSSSVAASMRHGQHTAIVILIGTRKFAINMVARTSITYAIRATTLDHEIGNYTVENQSVVKALFSQCYKVFYGIWGILLKNSIFITPFLVCISAVFIG
jgi:hypothetical protein